ncbi:MAG: DUF2239 family protein [Alphaproteobacteria bacterium]|jgi:uncharacterized protein|nr:DUF2239 family protein [Alphaproteobacteria bacterium]MBU2042481.1 DUF2239 family protein [Alphaproteobacteria bacterium]MBU2126291.1 DUF2239 family protein [Alphaproteobacteria bacterium]MBU2207335.1 DUF2239 family protein [Alphaproteobacteria bacterium]MBU2290097.1 DUF2239 family protein [Alphaproteobacteria bacterium]
MSVPADRPLFAFAGHRLLARGPAAEVVAAVMTATDAGEAVLTFDAADGRVVDLDLRGDLAAVLARLTPAPEAEKRGPGRPKLGVTAREVTLLPRHWDWLAGQPGGASVALRKLVEGALREAEGPDRARRAKEATYRFMTAIAGDLPGYEEATRMLFAGDWTAFDAATEAWPEGVRETARGMAAGAWRNGALA